MHRFRVAGFAALACAGLIIAGAPTESRGQGIAAPPVVVGACPPGTTAVGKKCVTFKQCPAGQHAEGETCKPCSPNHYLVGGECKKISIHTGKQCSEAEQWANKCKKNVQVKATDFAPKKCPAGQSPDGKKGCVKDIPASDFVPGCPAGQHWAGKKGCVKN